MGDAGEVLAQPDWFTIRTTGRSTSASSTTSFWPRTLTVHSRMSSFIAGDRGDVVEVENETIEWVNC